MRRRDAGEIELIAPTWVTLWSSTPTPSAPHPYSTVAGALDGLRPSPPPPLRASARHRGARTGVDVVRRRRLRDRRRLRARLSAPTAPPPARDDPRRLPVRRVRAGYPGRPSRAAGGDGVPDAGRTLRQRRTGADLQAPAGTGLAGQGRRRHAAHAHHRQQAPAQARRRRRRPRLLLHRAPRRVLDARKQTHSRRGGRPGSEWPQRRLPPPRGPSTNSSRAAVASTGPRRRRRPRSRLRPATARRVRRWQRPSPTGPRSPARPCRHFASPACGRSSRSSGRRPSRGRCAARPGAATARCGWGCARWCAPGSSRSCRSAPGRR